jgi:hypothetical protein
MKIHSQLRNKNFLFFLFFISLATRTIFYLLFLKDNPVKISFDSKHYFDIAQNILAGNGFSFDGHHPQFYRLPGYPIFIATCLFLFKNITSIIIIQILLSSFLPIIIFHLSKTLFPQQPLLAKITSIISCFYPGFLIFSGIILSETLFIFFFFLFLLLLFQVLELNNLTISYKKILLTGLFLGISSTIRAIGLPILITTLTIIFIISSITFLRKIKLSITITTGWIIPILPWIIRNFILTGHLFFHTLSGAHFTNHGSTRIIMQENNISYTAAQKKVCTLIDKKILEQKTLLGRPLQEIEEIKIKEKIFINIVKKHTFTSLFFFLTNIFKTLFSLYSSELLFIDSNGALPPYSHNRPIKDLFYKYLFPKTSSPYIPFVIYLEIITMLFLTFGVFLFMIQAFLKKNFNLIIKLFSFVGIFSVLSLVCGYARLRIPIEPIIIISACHSTITFFKKIQHKHF